MLTLTSENRSKLIHVLEAELPSIKPPLKDLCSAILMLLLDYEVLAAAVQDKLELATGLAMELQQFLDDTDNMRFMEDTLHTALHKCLNYDEVRETAGGLIAKLQACLEDSEVRSTDVDLIPDARKILDVTEKY